MRSSLGGVLGVLLTLSWRNVWRNKRRSAITILSIGSGLAAILFGQSLLHTIQHQLVEKATGVFTGHVQIVGRGVKDYKFPDVLIEDPGAIEAAVRGVGGIVAFERRMIVTGLISSKKESEGILIVGVEPEKDKRVITMHSYLKRGKFLGAEPDGIFMGDVLAAQLGLDLGDEAVVMASANDGTMGAEVVRVTGLYHSDSQTFDAQIAFVPLEAAQRLLAVDERVNNFVFKIEDVGAIRRVAADLGAALGERPVEVVTWEEVDYELVGIRDYQNALLGVVLLVVFVIVALGILNTLLMSMFERIREFGVLRALGARPGLIRRMIVLESCLMGVLGTAFGLAAGCAIIAYYGLTGLELPLGDSVGYFMPFDSILYLRFDWRTHLIALGVVLATSVLSGLPPALRASRMRPVDSLRHI